MQNEINTLLKEKLTHTKKLKISQNKWETLNLMQMIIKIMINNIWIRFQIIPIHLPNRIKQHHFISNEQR